jgi:hypothetical protein
VIFGWWLTTDKSRTPGWYKGTIMQRPEPKLACTGMTVHTVCIMGGPLAAYKLHCVHIWGQDIAGSLILTHNVATTQKWVNLMLVILDDIKGKGHCITMTPHIWETSWHRLAAGSGR